MFYIMELVKEETLKIEELDELEQLLKDMKDKIKKELEAYEKIYKNSLYEKDDPRNFIIGTILGVPSFIDLYLLLCYLFDKHHSIFYWIGLLGFIFLSFISITLMSVDLLSEKLRKDLIHKIDQFEEELFTIDMILGLIEEIKENDDEYIREILLNRLIKLLNDN